jgi:hypothetical protein
MADGSSPGEPGYAKRLARNRARRKRQRAAAFQNKASVKAPRDSNLSGNIGS